MSPIFDDMPHPAIQTLANCRPNQTCRIQNLTGNLATKLRLIHLGFHTHSHIKVITVCADNLVISLDGTRFAINTQLAKNIEVEMLS